MSPFAQRSQVFLPVFCAFYLIQLTGEIKQILETELGVPVSKMQLKGWKSGDVSDSVSLNPYFCEVKKHSEIQI